MKNGVRKQEMMKSLKTLKSLFDKSGQPTLHTSIVS